MPGSPAFERYTRDGALVLGGPAAILLQVADPVVAAGVAAHSAFAREPMRRLRHTLGYVYAVALGGAELRALAASMVDRAHEGVPGGRDPGRQLWVAATLAQTGIEVHELLHGRMEPALRAEILERAAAIGTLLQVPPGEWPDGPEAFDAYWADARSRLAVGEDAQRIADDILHPIAVPWWGRLAMPWVRVLTTGLLPPSLRSAYGLRYDAARFSRVVRIVRALHRLAPRALRELPSRQALARLSEASRSSS
ncbi:oxygenase MpaB family protein [Homoserinibacter sp. YIM 151385]|uniref:oxygenase MpaB family protein n=1 Tax=Homoserinibacter sp. YIM 151385 TaxID=2985506 RepID=UPI0022F003E4|nr:oxygenase MpaB family protein [Homoserinibacter sp. YIM 151385]WBU37744.1 oxygenase MpaB family protein [Homoserinibacter sp. YIM 151385]